ncbi:arabinan endo-1,5-alpha-L-arabinosidase [Mucilaginibacter sp. UR6-1]|uniref:arabinan endo-1,5-alpha-L-arabinosidase n=1 Tax=Mucilaginibacter sp. UR6-1 TaxID=1435643 RepID=UPI001E318017|nr:arabinan endo-1,5-alpha-L-arabinosidase [Mucilaginibacter sp. UR6-1]MCC8408998.1 arabinan endo-1,5-alpha-L-arabinosidase [Mucilaginibacter sp. UR6-1]
MKSIAKPVVIFALLILSLAAVGQGLKKDISVHDPVMIKQDSVYYIFCTGNGIAVWSSVDMLNWKREKPVFAEAPKWAVDTIAGFKGYIWAPDVSYHNGQYYLYYSVSVFGKNTSAIGVATNKTLHPDSPGFKWVDHGLVIRSHPGKTNWNAIDPNLITDDKGTPYLAFGSFWDGIKMVKLDADRLTFAEDIAGISTIASRKKDASSGAANAIEAPFIFKKSGYFYLFASVDYCCKGPESNYKMIVGRAKNIKGPYTDKQGIALIKGGGSLVLQPDSNWYGAGHNAVVSFNGNDYLVFHGYDAHDNGRPKLRILKLTWKKGWPEVFN